MDKDEQLKHYGVPGMKWGVRKDRNVGRKIGTSKKKRTPKDYQKVAKLKSNRSKQLSNKELETAIRRMELEKRYNDLNPKGVSKGLKIAAGIVAASTTINSVYLIGKSPVGAQVKKGVQSLIKKNT